MKMSKVSKTVIYILLGLVAIYFLSPFIYMLFSAFKTEAEAIAFPPKLFPSEWRFQNFADAWNSQPFGRYFLNSACRILPHASKDLFCCFYTAATPLTGSMINTIFIGINHLNNKISKHFGTCRTAVLFSCHLNDAAFFCLTNHRIYKTTALFGINP